VEEQRIYIRESNLSTAWNGDRVLVKLTKEGSRRRSPEGEVELILERSNLKRYSREADEHRLSGCPLDDRLLFEIDLHPPNGTNLAEANNHLSMWKFSATRWDNLPHWSGADPRQRRRNCL